MNIKYYFRNSNAGFSITTVFNSIVSKLEKNNNIERVYMPSPYAGIFSIIKNCLFAKQYDSKKSINHITGDVHYLLWILNRKRTVVTVHDIMYFQYLKGIKKIIWKFIYIYPLKFAAYITFISDEALKQVEKVIELDKKKIAVIPNPVDESFKYTDIDFHKEIRVLHIGTSERKNLIRSIEALKGIKCHLRIIGKLNNQTKEILHKNNISYSNVYNLKHEEIVEEYQKAHIVNFPSLLEGFGMPIVEGQASGRIVITSNLSPMKEVAGDGAILVDPTSIESIRKAYIKAIEDAEYREDIIKKGIINVEKYRLDKICDKYINIYNSII